MTEFTYESDVTTSPALGLIVLQTDERIESDFRQLIPVGVRLHISRVPSQPDVTPEALATMEAHIAGAANLLPGAIGFDALGYG